MSKIATLQCWKISLAYGNANAKTEEDVDRHPFHKMTESIIVSKDANGKPVKLYSQKNVIPCLNSINTSIVDLPKLKSILPSEGQMSYNNIQRGPDDDLVNYPKTQTTVTIDGNTLKAKVQSVFDTECFKPAVEFTLSTDKKGDKICKTYTGGTKNSQYAQLQVWAQMQFEVPVPNY